MEVHVQTAQNLAQGEISWAGKTYRCALGRSGIAANKAEGDGATPCGRFGFRQVFYRPDRRDPPATALPLQALRPEMGWSDDPADDEDGADDSAEEEQVEDSVPSSAEDAAAEGEDDDL